MYIDDDFARAVVIDIMDIRDDEPYFIESLDEHIKNHGLEKLFVQLIKLYGPLSRLK